MGWVKASVKANNIKIRVPWKAFLFAMERIFIVTVIYIVCIHATIFVVSSVTL